MEEEEEEEEEEEVGGGVSTLRTTADLLEAAARIVADGVAAVDGVEAVVKTASEATAEDLTGCDAVCIGTPDCFSYMAGMLKDFFDRVFYATRGQVDGKPCGTFVTHGGGGRAVESVDKICKSFKLEQVSEAVLVQNSPDQAASEALRELGVKLANAAG